VFENYAGALDLILHANVIFAIAGGTVLGIFMGAMPGLTATMAIALLLPLTYGMPIIMGFGMLLGSYCGAISGGSISAILLNIPGTPSSVATTFDGYKMTQKGKEGEALGKAVIASFIGGILSTFALTFISPPIAKFALKFGATEYFSLAFFGLAVISSVSKGSLLKGIIAGFLGIFISLVGVDPIVGLPRFTYSQPALLSGIPLLPALIGLFAVSQALQEVENVFFNVDKGKKSYSKARLSLIEYIPGVLKHWRLLLVSTFIGAGIGAIPGAGGTIASFVSYDQAKKMSKTPEKFGTGHVEGVLAPETANNAMTGGGLIPMMALGVPGEACSAILMGGLIMKGLRPGPLLFRDQPQIVYAIFIALFIANLFMLIFQFYGVRLFAKVLQVQKIYLIPIILVFCVVGGYGVGGKIFDVYLLIGFGIFGYFLKKYNFPMAAIILGIILGRIAESNFRRAMIMFDGNWTVFFIRPISITFLLCGSILIFLSIYHQWKEIKK